VKRFWDHTIIGLVLAAGLLAQPALGFELFGIQFFGGDESAGAGVFRRAYTVSTLYGRGVKTRALPAAPITISLSPVTYSL
jgi:hypothetical protein